MAGLTLNHIYKVYPGGVKAVNDFNLEIKDKEFIVFVGPSGCGKSTTLRMIAGIEGITAGQLYIDNELVNDLDSKDRDIAMVFQNYALYPHMSVYQNMAFGLKLRHTDPKIIDDRVKKAAEILEISDLLNRKPKELSGGQRQRVALGRAIVRDPKVFLLDEPLSNLDAKLRVQMRTEITKLHKELQTTFIYVTHDQTEAMTMGDRIVVMKDGFMQQADTPIALFEDPSNLFVATFLGSPQMNIIEGNLIEDGLLFDFGNEYKIKLNENIQKQIKEQNYDINNKVLLGVRPEHVHISKSGLAAKVDVIEQLGDETILYCQIEGLNKNIVVKTPLTGNIKRLDEIYLSIEPENIYLFDKNNEHSIIGLPLINKLNCQLINKQINIGEEKINLDDEFMSHLLINRDDNELKIGFSPSDVYLKQIEHSNKINVYVDFVIPRTNYLLVYSKIKNVNGYIVFKAPLDQKYEKNEQISIYIPLSKIKLYDENNNLIKSREIIFENNAYVDLINNKNKTIIKFNNNESLIYDDLKLENGKYKLILDEEKINIIFNKKMTKALGITNNNYNKNQLLNVSCYDEEVVGSKNIIFAEIKGFNEEYVTLLTKNNFSVYKMPKFKIEVPVDAIKLIKINE